MRTLAIGLPVQFLPFGGAPLATGSRAGEPGATYPGQIHAVHSADSVDVVYANLNGHPQLARGVRFCDPAAGEEPDYAYCRPPFPPPSDEAADGGAPPPAGTGSASASSPAPSSSSAAVPANPGTGSISTESRTTGSPSASAAA